MTKKVYSKQQLKNEIQQIKQLMKKQKIERNLLIKKCGTLTDAWKTQWDWGTEAFLDDCETGNFILRELKDRGVRMI